MRMITIALLLTALGTHLWCEHRAEYDRYSALAHDLADRAEQTVDAVAEVWK